MPHGDASPPCEPYSARSASGPPTASGLTPPGVSVGCSTADGNKRKAAGLLSVCELPVQKRSRTFELPDVSSSGGASPVSVGSSVADGNKRNSSGLLSVAESDIQKRPRVSQQVDVSSSGLCPILYV